MIHGPDNQIFVFGGSAAAVPFLTQKNAAGESVCGKVCWWFS